jgi:hypothetical protein
MIAIPAVVLALTTDRGLAAVGIAAAIGSAVFATFMISQNSTRDMPKGVEHPGVFARALYAQSHQSQVHANKPGGRHIDSRTIDYDVTGSIASNLVRSAASGASTNSIYLLRFVHKEAALLQSSRGFYVARQGTMLPGAGEVLSIERVGDMWVLATATRIFTEVRDNLP